MDKKEGELMGEVYILTFPSEMSYVGKTTGDFEKRFGYHKRDARMGSKLPVHRAIRKYGQENILINRIECPDELLDEMEMMWIKVLNTMKPNGYNLTTGGDGGCSFRSEETREKISKNNARYWEGKKRSPETNEKISARNKGRKHSIEELEKMSVIHKGKKLSNEHKEKISIANKGKNRTDEQKKNLSNLYKGRIPSCVKRITYLVTTPEGMIVIETDNLSELCRQYGLSQAHMNSIAQGKRKQHKGFTCQYADNP